jgi:hypothetical protein
MTEIAGRMGLAYNTFYSRINGRVVFSPEEVRTLIAAAPDRRFAEYFLEDSPFKLSLREPGDIAETSRDAKILTLLTMAAGVLEAAQTLAKDADHSASDEPAFDHALDRSERALDALRESKTRR